jgi:hypothetical protein
MREFHAKRVKFTHLHPRPAPSFPRFCPRATNFSDIPVPLAMHFCPLYNFGPCFLAFSPKIGPLLINHSSKHAYQFYSSMLASFTLLIFQRSQREPASS